MSDASAKRQADMFNQQRFSRGLSNAIQLAGAATGIYGAVQGANLAGAQADYLRGATAMADPAAKFIDASSGRHPRDRNFINAPTQTSNVSMNNDWQLASNYSPNRMGGDTNTSINQVQPWDQEGMISWPYTQDRRNFITNQNAIYNSSS